MEFTQSTKISRFTLVFILGLLIYFSFLGGSSVFQVAEARNAQCAREMLERNDWIVPTFNGELRTDKPVLEYYGMMVAYSIGGVNEASARFFSALCGFLLLLATFLIVKRHLGEKAAFWSALALLASLHATIQMRLATPDPYLILFHVLSIYFFFEGWATGRWKWYAGMYISLGLAILAKGPVGLALPALSIFLFLLFTRTFNWKTIVALKPWWGILLTLLISVPWYVAVHLKTDGAWTNGFFFEHNLDRFSDGMGNHDGPFILTIVFILAGMLPFSVWFVRSFKTAWIDRKNEKLVLLSIVSLATVAVFYAISKTKLINYTAPSYPFFAIITGYYFAKLLDGKLPKSNIKPELYALAVVTLAIPPGIYFFTKYTEPLGSITWVAFLFLLLPVGGILAVWYYKRSLLKSLLSIAISFMATTLIFFAVSFQVLDNQSPIRIYQDYIESYEHVVAYKDFDHAFAFYADKTIPVFESLNELNQYLETHDGVLVLSRARDLSYMDKIPNLECIREHPDLFSLRSSGIYREKPTQ